MEINRAHVRRTLTVDGRLCGEVEVQTDDPHAPGMLVYFAKAPGGGFEAVRIVENDASTEIDWYENPIHQAFTDRTDAYGAGRRGVGGADDLARRVLGHGAVEEALSRELER